MIKRILIYFHDMFPIQSWIGTWIGTAMVLNLAQKLGGTEVKIDMIVIRSGFAVCLFNLIMRVMDEFKDYDDDLVNFPDRPLPSRRVRFSDLKFLGWLCVICSLWLSLWNQWVLLASVAVLSYLLLMLKWFFIEKKMRKSLPLAFLTHHPIVVFQSFYTMTVAWFAGYNSNIYSLLSLLPISFIATNWEICRKIRAPQDETAYTTYSKIWGARTAVCAAIILQTIILGVVLYFMNKLNLSIWIGLGFTAVFIISMLPSLLFFWSLNLIYPLRQIAEAQMLLVVLTLMTVAWI